MIHNVRIRLGDFMKRYVFLILLFTPIGGSTGTIDYVQPQPTDFVDILVPTDFVDILVKDRPVYWM